MPLSATERTRHRRMRENGRTSFESLFEVLRAGFVCHLGVVVVASPLVPDPALPPDISVPPHLARLEY